MRLLLVLLAGCQVVFPLRDRSEPDAALEDAALPADASTPRCPGGVEATRHVLPAVADSSLGSGVPNQNYGGLGVATISADLGPLGSRGLFRFDLGAIDPVAILELSLILPSAMSSDDCGPGCGNCAGIEQTGTLRAYPVTDAWVESQVTWARASTALAWNQPGAAGTDRGPELAAAQHAIGIETTLTAAPAQLPALLTWVANANLSIVVEGDAKQVVRTRENLCDGGASGARLEVLRC